MSSAGSSGLQIVAIAGGAGTRFWPLSRRARPKQLLSLAGEATLLGATFTRVAGIAPADHWWMVVGEAHAEACRRAVPAVPPERVLVEPCGRNTAPAVALAAIHIAAASPGAVMVVLPADHWVADGLALTAALRQAAAVAEQGAIVTLGITPSHPETGYGYIERGEPDPRGGYRAARFCEKPDIETARAFVADGTFYWNAGIFILRPDIYMAELRRQLPEHHAAFERLAAHLGAPDYAERLVAAYEGMDGISIDFGIMEGAGEVVVVPVECGWTDVGSFDAMASLGVADGAGNVASGRVVTDDCEGCLVHSDEGHIVALVGVSDLVVVHTTDATLVIPRERAQEVKRVVHALAERGWLEVL